MVRRAAVRFVAVVALTLPVASQAMTVADFLGKADALQARGFTAMFSSDIGVLKEEIKSASTAYRDHVDTGKAPRSCPPAKGTVKTSSDELLAAFRTVPAADRTRLSVRAAFADYMIRRFPCR
jgi:hypothetical protein